MHLTSRSVHMGCSILAQSGKTGVLKPDADGYYEVPLGAYGTPNSVGWVYDVQSASELFQEGSRLKLYLNKGILRGEYGHPDVSNLDKMAQFQRIRKIDEEKVAFHIRGLRLDTIYENGREVVRVLGQIKPSGPYGQYIKESLENPHENTHFSVRAITLNDQNTQIKYTKEIVTWDFVNHGGIEAAQKYASPSLESTDVELDRVMVYRLAQTQRESRLSLESGECDFADLAQKLGWDLNTKGPVKPGYMDW